MKESLILHGTMPQRGVAKLATAGITLFDVKKIEKNQILLRIRKKDIEKAFAIYPILCYNDKRDTVYFFTRAGDSSVRARELARKRYAGIALGAALFVASVGVFSSIVFRIEIVGASVYEREIKTLLAEQDLKEFFPYKRGREDIVTAKILALDGVEFCSVQKSGGTLKVELRMNAFSSAREETGDFISAYCGKLVSLVVLRGQACAKVGDELSVGSVLAEACFVNESGEKFPTSVVAKAKIYCEQEFTAETEEGARLAATLYAESVGGRIDGIRVTAQEEGFTAKAGYFVTVKKNM